MKLFHGMMFGMLLAIVTGCAPPSPPRDPRGTLDLQKPSGDKDKGKSSEITKNPEPPGPANKDKPKEKEKETPNPVVSPTDDEGILRGKVLWRGELPRPTARVEECFVFRNEQRVPVRPPLMAQVDSATEGVSGVMVWLKKAPATEESPAPGTLTLTQTFGSFHPAAQIVLPRTVLRLRTADDEADFQGRGCASFNRLLRRRDSVQITLERPGLLTVRSEDRPWIRPSYIRVVEHGFHAISGKDGSFTLPTVPAGEYQVVLWHPTGGKGNVPVEITVPVKLVDKQGAVIRWTLPLK